MKSTRLQAPGSEEAPSAQRPARAVRSWCPGGAWSWVFLWCWELGIGCFAADVPQTVPGWRMELIAEAPQVSHPSVVCTAPDGRIFVAEDPMDIRTPRADAMEGRILCLHPGGRITVFAANLYAVFGMQYLEGKLYVLHNPKFSVFTDDNGVGQDRLELLEQTNPKPWALDWNDHVPANFRLGLDGFFYVAIGDKGLYGAVGRDGSRVDLPGGGILRLRPDGTKLEVFARGVRNIMDVAMNAEDDLFTYDNTDEHDWMGRLTHMVERGTYGYPHDFIPRRPYTLWMMHDFGGGAATGTECYTEDALPLDYRGNLFLADFGKRQVLRVWTERAGATWRVVKHQEMFPNPPESFRPVGLAWAADGLSLLICDWAHRDTKEDVKVGRLWKATFTNASAALPKPAWHAAAAMGHACTASDAELSQALEHPSRSVRLTAQRVFIRRVLPGEGAAAARVLDSNAARQNPALENVLPPHERAASLELAVGATRELPGTNGPHADPAFRGANRGVSRAVESPPRGEGRGEGETRVTEAGVKIVQRLTRLLTNPTSPTPARPHALWALDAIDEGRAVRAAIVQLARNDPDPALRRQAMRQLGLRRAREARDTLSALVRDPATEASLRFQAATALGRIGDSGAIPALAEALDQTDVFARYAAFTALNEIGRQHPGTWAAVAEGLGRTNARIREATAFALRETYDAPLVAVLAGLASSSASAGTREAALRLLAPLHHRTPPWQGEWGAYHPALAPPPQRTVEWPGTKPVLAALAAALHDPASAVRLAAIEGLQAADHRVAAPSLRALFPRETDPAVRRAVLRALTDFKDTNAAVLIAGLLRQPPPDDELVRAAVRAASVVGGKDGTDGLVQLARSRHGARPEALAALGQLRAVETVPVLAAALTDSNAAVRLAAIRALGEIKGADALAALRPVADSKSPPERRALARALGGWTSPDTIPLLLQLWRDGETRTEALEGLARRGDARALDAYLGGLASANPTVRQQCRQALDGIRASVLADLEARAATLSPTVIAELREAYRGHDTAKKGALFATTGRVPTPGDYARFALETPGDAARGQRLFWDESGVACLKCHQVAGHGAQVGPDLTLIGAQFPRRELIEHILEPGQVVREGYQQFTIETREGENWSGLIKGETADALTIINSAGQLQSIPKKDITGRTVSRLSLMPEGLHAGLSTEQFADLIAFLESRKTDPRGAEIKAPPEGFVPLLETGDANDTKARGLQAASASTVNRPPVRPEGRAPVGWRELPPGTQRVDARALQLGRSPEHWFAKDGVLEHDGLTGDLWTEREFGDFALTLEWRWADAPKWADFPLINAEGLEAGPDGRAATLRVLDAGDSGVLLRGLYKAQANLFCYPVGSGEFWEYRTDPNSTREQRRAFTPMKNADRPIGDWNEMKIQLRGDRVTVEVNGEKVISHAELPGVPPRGPIGLQHEHGRIQFRNVFIRETKP